jgi:U3 small nucleolar RNA-associated protein 18
MVKQQFRNKAQSLLQPRQYGYDGCDSDASEKDATEIELEKLVFGDESGFREGIRSHKQHSSELVFEENDDSEGGTHLSEGEGVPGHDEGLEGVDDADVGIG